MVFPVLVTEIANEDLAGLVRYIARDNPPAAERFGLALLDKVKLLREHPLLGRIVPERGEPSLREIIHHPYRIVYPVSVAGHRRGGRRAGFQGKDQPSAGNFCFQRSPDRLHDSSATHAPVRFYRAVVP